MDLKAAEIGRDGFRSDEEEDGYDYGQEIDEVYLKRRSKNDYFEQIYFKKDPKHALIYTNEELMKK
jgi:hypothetical protein